MPFYYEIEVVGDSKALGDLRTPSDLGMHPITTASSTPPSRRSKASRLNPSPARPMLRRALLFTAALSRHASPVAAARAQQPQPCYSGRQGDSITKTCSAFCRPDNGAAHCAMCKCKLCDFCAKGIEEKESYVEVHCKKPNNKTIVPFVMWMSERTGSSWVTDLLNSHPDASMGGESSMCTRADDDAQAECLRGLCKYLTTPVGQPPCPTQAWPQCPRAGAPMVRGIKQKLFLCDDDPVGKAQAFARDSMRSPPVATDPLDACLGHHSRRFNRSWVAESNALFMGVGARVVCSLRRNAFELAMSSYVLRHVLGPKCHAANLAHGSGGEACWEAQKRAGVHVDEEAFLSILRPLREVIEFQRSVCERLARTTPVFFLWYEDLVADFGRTTFDLQAFLSLKPMVLRSQNVKVGGGSDSYSWVSNLLALRAAVSKTLVR